MTRPTDSDLNRTMAEALGWQETPSGWLYPGATTVGGSYLPRGVPDYCTDRNTLPEIGRLLMLQTDAMLDVFETECGRLCPGGRYIGAVGAPARAVVVAALRSLGRWSDDWQAEP